jgi:acyl-CoA thioesterase FadM
MLLRTLLLMIACRFRSRLGHEDVSRLRRRVLPNDLDILGHMNNGVYFSVMDLGRLDLGLRSGAWQAFSKRGWYPVAASETMSFRRSLQPWQRYVVESRVIGYDDKAMYTQQRFVVDGEIYAEGIVRARFVRKSGGTVTMAELGEAVGVDTAALPLPAWIPRWAEDVAMPPARGSFQSTW